MPASLHITVLILLSGISAATTYNSLVAWRNHNPETGISVRMYRNRCGVFFGNLIAGLFHFQFYDFFDINPAVREAPRLQEAV